MSHNKNYHYFGQQGQFIIPKSKALEKQHFMTLKIMPLIEHAKENLKYPEGLLY
jgi:hypothetical protein